MKRRLIAVLMLSLLMLNVVMLALEVSPARASGTIYIMADGSINPPTAPISTSDNIIYSLTSNTDSSIVVQRNNILFHGNGFTVQGAGSGTGIDLSAVSNVTIEETYVAGFQYGVALYSTSANSILMNYLIQNQIGVFLGSSSNNTIGGNEVINSTYAGILMNVSSYNTISKNNITTNYDGILVDFSFDNTIIHNNFVESTSRQVDIVSPGSGNVYDEGYPWCGNYWSDYNGTDVKSGPFQNETGSDGVGDTAHVLGDFHVDDYPLMNPWTSNFTVLSHMVVGYAHGPSFLDPAVAGGTMSGVVIMNVYEPLIFFQEEKTDQFVQRLATSWEISPDGLSYAFRIRQGVKFHNGETLTPEDVEYSLERIFVIETDTPSHGGFGFLFYEAFFNVSGSRDEFGNFTVTGQQIDDAITRNDTSVVLHLTRPYAPMMQILAQWCASILCKKWCVQIGDWPGTWNNWTLYNRPTKTAIELQSTSPPGPRTNAMCGSGPFMFDYYEANIEWQLVKFDDYWGSWPANGSDGYLKRVTGKIMSDWETRKNGFLDGRLDSLAVPVTGVDEVLGQPGVQSIYPLEELACYAFFFTFDISTSSPFMGVPGGLPRGTLDQSGIAPDFFTDINVRKGFAYAFNYSRFITEALRGEASQPATPIIPGLPYCNPAQEKYSINMTRASQCFSDAWSGQLWSSGFNFTMCYPPTDIVRQKACEIMKANVESLNPKFHIQIRLLPIPNYINLASDHSLPMFQFGWQADFADPHDFAEGFMYSSSVSGTFAPMQSYSNSTIDALVQQGIDTMNETARRQTYYALQSAYHDDCPSIPMYQPLGRRFQRDWVQGWYFNPLFSEDYFYTEWKGGTSNPTRYSWPMFHHDPTHTGHTESPAPNTNQLRWNYTTGNYVGSSPAVVDGKVYVGSDDCNVYCLDDSTGAKIWNYTTGNAVTSSPAVGNGKVYVGSYDGKVYCLDAATGTHVWNYTTGGVVFSSPAVVDGKVYVGSYAEVYCLDAATGTHVWNYTTGNAVTSSPAVGNGKVYVGSYDGKVYCLDAATGTHVWNYTTGGFVDSSPAVVDGKVYVGSYAEVYCLDAATGTHVWNYTTGYWVVSSPAVVDGKVYVGSYDGKVYCLDAATGTHVWNYTTGNAVTSSPAVGNGKVYVGSYDGKVYCLDAATGTHVWNYTTGGFVFSSPAVGDGVVYVGSRDGQVYAFGNVVRVPEDYETIQEAINAASPGATIWIAPGIYHESLVINKTITLIGKPGSEPIFDGGGSGIAIRIVSSGSGSTIAGIIITCWDQGILVDGASDCKIYDNIMSLMNNNGIVLQGTSAVNNQVYSNIFQQDAVAVDVTSSSCNNTITQNIIQFSTTGLKIETNGITICENMISQNYYGLIMINSDNNTIYHNNFVDNTTPVQISFSTSTKNKWDNGYPQGGNYWTAYTGADLKGGPSQAIPGSDGIGDTPYTIAVNNTDNYPLMKPFNEHDIGIAGFIVHKTVICRGYTCNISLSVLNYGLHDETFNLAIWANQTRIILQPLVLTNRSSTYMTFTWNTTDFPYGNYTLSSVADTVQGETNTANNKFPDGWVVVSIVGDVTGPNGWPDGKCDMLDVGRVARLFGANSPNPPYNPNYDIDDNGRIDMRDIGTIARHFGEHYP